MRRTLLAAAVVILAACATEAPQAQPEPTTATELTTTTQPATTTTVDWLTVTREANQSDVDITAATLNGDVLTVTTDLGYAPDDPVRRGMATEVCFAINTVWDRDIQVNASNNGPLAWTGSHREGCRGF